MEKAATFDPINAAQKIEGSYREYLASTFHFDDSDLQAQLESILNTPGYLAKGPFLEAAPPYCKGESVADLVAEGVLCKSMLSLGGGNRGRFDPDRPLYVHQVQAIKKAVSERNFAVVTGTGSGKTECFLLPILNDILLEFETKGPSAGIRAMILYPMNALANDQLKRLRELLVGTGVTFGRYTGDTAEDATDALVKWKEENPGAEKLPNEIISRDEIRKNPPNILLTNYSMLEYLLLRPKDAPLFGSVFGMEWRHLALDEAHVYSGALGTEIAYLIRRLKARIESETEKPIRIHCYATSATIGSQHDMPKVAAFAQDLFGERFSSDPDDLDVITSEKDDPRFALDAESWGSLPLETWKELRSLLTDSETIDGDAVRSLLAGLGVPSGVLMRMDGCVPLLGLGKVLLGERSSMILIDRCAGLLDLTDISQIETIGIEGLSGDARGVEVLTAMVEVLSSVQRSEGIPLLSSRYHSFLRAPEGLFLNLSTKELSPYKKLSVPYGDEGKMPIYEVSVCRHCGQAYILGKEVSDRKNRFSWLDPRHEGIDADDEFIPRCYYRILSDAGEKDGDEQVVWICPICGSLHSAPDEGEHLFSHSPVARIPIALNSSKPDDGELDARCRHCGYSSRIAIQSFRVSPEAVGSVVCYDLMREVPPFDNSNNSDEDDWFASEEEVKRAGSVICFSDRRQDAAFFAPSLDRSYGAITRRQLMREAVESKDSEGCSPSSVISWMADVGEERYSSLFGSGSTDPKGIAEAWLLDELAAEDSRNSLEGLGVIRVEPTKFNEGFASEIVKKHVSKQVGKLSAHERLEWITDEDYVLFLKVCLETLRERNAIEVSEGVAEYRLNHEKRGNVVISGDDLSMKAKHAVRFVGSSSPSTENKRSAFIRKYASKIHGASLQQSDVVTVLQSLFEFLGQYLGGYFNKKKYLIGSRDKFRLSKDIWTLYPHSDNDVVYVCDSCGCETHLDTRGVCPTLKCKGETHALTFAKVRKKDRYYKDIYQEEALPIDVEEHTAQLSSKKAREIQNQFLKGNVNVLSCTTTFELGVDVGDLRAIFMRNIPPTAANYTQRAGRVGRRVGKPGFAITFARLRPHDIAYFSNPAKIISGETRVPVCYLDNDTIAFRHVFAVALSEFFRAVVDRSDGLVDYSHFYNSFMNLSESEPKGLKELRRFLEDHPEPMRAQLQKIVSDDLPVSSVIGVDEWRWIPSLVGGTEDVLEGSGKGRLLRVHDIKHADYSRITDGIETYRDSDSGKTASLYKSKEALESERTISVLAENGILPKYGFPTDLVELHLPAIEQSVEDNRLSLSRGMRQAIREYAPGSEVVAGKTLWKSVGIKKPRDQGFTVRNYGKCPNCQTFVWPIKNFRSTTECPVCHSEIQLEKKMLVPSYGFIGKKQSKGIGLRRPRSKGRSLVYFSQHWPDETVQGYVDFAGGRVNSRYAGNGQLCALNEPRSGFRVCEYCNAAASSGDKLEHENWCKGGSSTAKITHFNALGTAFVSDILELTFELKTFPDANRDVWESVMWALFTAGSSLLEIPESELGGTLYKNEAEGFSVMVYDDVPGGAGHARQLSEMVQELVEEAYRVVDGHCGCGGETCCYGCIANYYNQPVQSRLSRGAAKKVFGSLLGKNLDQ